MRVVLAEGTPRGVALARAGVARSVRAVLAPSPIAMRRIALAGVIATAGIVVTGAAVRLSDSGLGCPDWPRCTRGSLVAAHTRGDPIFHTWIEFGNRMVTLAVFVVAAIVFVAAWRYRAPGQAGRRRDLVWLAAAQPGGVFAQALLGGLLVLSRLNPVLVAVHYLASAAIVGTAVALHVRCTEGSGPARPLARPDLRVLAWALACVVGLMLAAGTVVTGTGPLAGAGDVPRFHFPLGGVTQLHADIGWLLGGLMAALVVGLHLSDAPVRARRLAWLLLGLILTQGVIGYTQYFTGLPAGLVWVHVAGSTLTWIVALRLAFALRDRGAISVAANVPGDLPAESGQEETSQEVVASQGS